MKKRVSILGLLLICILGLCACGQNTAQTDAEAEKEGEIRMMGANAGLQIVSTLQQMQMEGSLEDNLGQDDTMDALINNFISGMEDVGEIVSMDQPEVEVDGKNVIINVPITGDLEDPDGNPRTAVIEMVMKSDFQTLPSLAVNPKYTSSELMTKAGLNTLLGMGVTFTILILISLIISCFTLLNKVQGKAKDQEGSAAAASVDNAVRQIVAGEEQEDETELIAVISAAIAAYESQNGGYVSADGVMIRSIRKINKTKWQNA